MFYATEYSPNYSLFDLRSIHVYIQAYTDEYMSYKYRSVKTAIESLKDTCNDNSTFHCSWNTVSHCVTLQNAFNKLEMDSSHWENLFSARLELTVGSGHNG